MLNFLQYAAFVQANIKINEKGEAIVKDFPAFNFSNI